MRKNIFILFVVAIFVSSCNITKSKNETDTSALQGSWELNYISGPRIAFDGLYPNKKPVINFDVAESKVSGNNSCNSFSGKLVAEANKIDFTQPMMTTKMMCGDGQGEQIFMSTLEKINTFSISDDGKTLNFISGDIALMRFTKK